ncbi:MAG: SMC-Scp complex subunit ScpB [Oscillospiraceae bacterium]
MNTAKLKTTLEGILFACGDPVPAARISLILATSEEDVLDAADELAREYIQGDRGIRLLRLAGSLQLCSSPELAQTISRVIEHRAPPKLSPPALEALAVIAYFQPVTRAYVEQVRGVDSSYTVGSLAEKGLIEPCGRLDAPGRPTLYKTTDAFLRVMGLTGIEELPPLPDMASTDGVEKLQAAIEELRGRGEQLSLTI